MIKFLQRNTFKKTKTETGIEYEVLPFQFFLAEETFFKGPDGKEYHGTNLLRYFDINGDGDLDESEIAELDRLLSLDHESLNAEEKAELDRLVALDHESFNSEVKDKYDKFFKGISKFDEDGVKTPEYKARLMEWKMKGVRPEDQSLKNKEEM